MTTARERAAFDALCQAEAALEILKYSTQRRTTSETRRLGIIASCRRPAEEVIGEEIALRAAQAGHHG